MRFMLRLLVVFVVITAVISIVRGMFAPSTPVRNERGRVTGRLVKDPVCGMYIAEENALRANGNFFCSEECQRKFIERT